MKHLVSSTDKIAAVSQVKLNYDQQKSSGKKAAMKTEGEWATRTGNMELMTLRVAGRPWQKK